MQQVSKYYLLVDNRLPQNMKQNAFTAIVFRSAAALWHPQGGFPWRKAAKQFR